MGRFPGKTFLLTALFAVFTVIMLCGSYRFRSVVIGGRRYVRGSDLAVRYGMRTLRRYGRTIEYGGRSNALVLEQHKRQIKLNGIKTDLSYPVAKRWRELCVSTADHTAVIAPVLEKTALRKHPIATIMIDPGHGGKDKGASGRSSREKDVVLRLGRRAAQILRGCGYRVIMTRNSDAFLSLGARALKQRRSNAQIFVSLHINAAANRSVNGIETFCLTPAGAPSSGKSRAVGAGRCQGNRWDANNMMLAWQMQKALLRRTQAVDRGVKRARFAVLRDIDVPGVLVEVGFISNYREERLLNSTAYIEKLARGIAEGIIHYHRSMR